MANLTREEFIKLLIDLAIDCDCELHTLLTAATIADQYIDTSGQTYSENLLAVSANLASKCCEERPFALRMCSKLINLERTICAQRQFVFPRQNILTLISYLLGLRVEFTHPRLHADFRYLTFALCLDKSLLHANPLTVLVACVILHRHGKLPAIELGRTAAFTRLTQRISYEYELPLDAVYRGFIHHYRDATTESTSAEFLGTSSLESTVPIIYSSEDEYSEYASFDDIMIPE
jgi:hypothetical protein